MRPHRQWKSSEKPRQCCEVTCCLPTMKLRRIVNTNASSGGRRSTRPPVRATSPTWWENSLRFVKTWVICPLCWAGSCKTSTKSLKNQSISCIIISNRWCYPAPFFVENMRLPIICRGYIHLFFRFLSPKKQTFCIFSYGRFDTALNQP